MVEKNIKKTSTFGRITSSIQYGFCLQAQIALGYIIGMTCNS